MHFGSAGRMATVTCLAMLVAWPAPDEARENWDPGATPKVAVFKVVVTGSVSEADSGLPVNGAKVTITRSGTQETVEAATNFSGGFRVVLTKPGIYFANAEADGYIRPSPLNRRPVRLRVTSDTREARADLVLFRVAAISGHVVEEPSKRPVPGLRVQALSARYMRGHLTLLPVLGAATTDAEGVFRVAPVPPGEFVLAVSPAVREKIVGGRLGDYSEENPRPVGYARMYWSPLTGMGEVVPFRVRSGVEMNLGRISVEKSALYRIRGSLESAVCSAGDQIQVSLRQQSGLLTFFRARAVLPCGSAFTVTNLGRGTYQLSAWVKGRQPQERAFAEARVKIEEDLDLPLVLVRPELITGKVRFPKGFPDSAKSKITFRLSPIGSLPTVDARSTQLETSGRFQLPLFHRPLYELIVRGLKAPYCVMEVSYNGSKLPGTIFTPNRYALDQSLDVVISGQAATLAGSVVSGDSPVPGAQVLLAPWPLQLKRDYPVLTAATADEDGHFRITGLRPGSYRILTATAVAKRRLEKPGEMTRAFSSAEDVELPRGGGKSVTLDLLVLQ